MSGISLYQDFLENNIIVEFYENKNKEVNFRINKSEENKVLEILERKYPDCKINQTNIIKLSIVGYGITQDNIILNKIIANLKLNNIKIKDINLTQSKIEIIIKNIENHILEDLHRELIRSDEK